MLSSAARRSCAGRRTTASRSTRPSTRLSRHSRRRSSSISPTSPLPIRRAASASPAACSRGRPYVGADFRFDPVRFEPFARPALAVIGTGKRGREDGGRRPPRPPALARPLRRGRRDGPGRPRSPVVVDREPELDETPRALARGRPCRLRLPRGRGVRERGHRREPQGWRRPRRGAVLLQRRRAAAELAASLSPDLVVFEGSGAAIPPVETGKRILVVGASQDPATVIGYLGAYRVLLSDLVVLTGCEEPLADEDQVQEAPPGDRRGEGRARPADDLQATPGQHVEWAQSRLLLDRAGRRARAPARASSPRARRRDRPHLREPRAGRASRRPRVSRGALGRALSRRAEGGRDRRRRRDRRRAGVPVVLCDNEVRTIDGESLDERVLELAEALEGARA